MNKILVVADRIEDKPVAVNRALKLADAYDGGIHVVYFCYENLRHVPGDKDKVKQQIIDHLAEKAQEQIKNIDTDVHVTLEVIWEKHLHQWVGDYVNAHQPILVVKTGHRSESMIYTSTDWHILRECQSPVLIACGEKWRRSDNVLAAIDLGSKNPEKLALNHKVLAQAKQLAEYFEVELHVCYVAHMSPLLRDLGVSFKDEVQLKAEKTLRDDMTELARQYGLDQNRFHIQTGLPHKVIPSEAAK